MNLALILGPFFDLSADSPFEKNQHLIFNHVQGQILNFLFFPLLTAMSLLLQRVFLIIFFEVLPKSLSTCCQLSFEHSLIRSTATIYIYHSFLLITHYFLLTTLFTWIFWLSSWSSSFFHLQYLQAYLGFWLRDLQHLLFQVKISYLCFYFESFRRVQIHLSLLVIFTIWMIFIYLLETLTSYFSNQRNFI